MAKYGWDGIVARITCPESGDTVNSEPFTIPRGAKSVAIHIGANALGAITWSVEALTPVVDVDGLARAAETWTAVAVFDLTDGSFEALDGIPESQVTVIPVTAFGGGGVYRFVASADISAEPEIITLVFGMDG